MKKPASKKTSTAKLSLLQVIINALEDLKAQNIVTLDVSRLTYVTDTLVIASGSSSRQVRALAQNAVEDVKKNGMASIGIEGLDGGEWVLADFGDVVLHVMQPETREFYDLENLWQTRETKAAATETKTDAKKSSAAKSTTAKPASKKEAFIAEAEFTTQSDAAKARKSPGKPKAKPSSASSKKPVAKAAPVKAGVRAKTGTKKPAASKAVSEKTTVKKTAAKKVAAPKTVAPKPKLAAPKLTAKKSTKAKPAAKKPAARKSPAK